MWIRFLTAAGLLIGLIGSAGRAHADPKIDGSDILTLDRVVAAAFQQNPELKALLEDAEAVKAKASKARYWDDPMIGVRFYQIPFSGGFDETQDIDYIVRQKFPLGGKDKAQAQIAFHEYQHRLHLLSGRGREILRDLKTTFYELFAVDKMLAVSRELEGNYRALVKSAQARLATGQSSLGDAAQGQTEMAKTLVERQELLQRRRELLAKLGELTAGAIGEEAGSPAKPEAPRWDIELAPLLEIAAAHHPALMSDQHHIEEKEWGVKAAKREYIPDLNVQAEYVQRPGNEGDAFTGELMINIPLIAKKKRLGVREAEAELASARFMGQANRNEINSRIQSAFGRLQASERTLVLSGGTLLPQARQSYQTSFSAYTTGKTGIADVLNAARMLREAQLIYWKAYAAQAAAVFALENDVGRTREEYENERKQP
jgi:outer membrane protein TolC